MASHGALAEPTATEVLFELRFNSSRSMDLYADVLKRRFADSYPQEENLHSVGIGFKVEAGPAGQKITVLESGDGEPEDLDIVTRRFRSLDGKTLFQIGAGVITVNTTDYQGFDKFVNEMLNVLKVHNDLAGVNSYRRFGLRYINQIPLSEAMPYDVFNWTAPMPPDASPDKQVLSNVQDVVTKVGGHGFQKLTVAYPQADQNGTAVMLLDIDYFAEFAEPLTSEISALVGWVNSAHERIWEAYTLALTPTFLERRRHGAVTR